LTIEPSTVVIPGIEKNCYTIHLKDNTISFSPSCTLPDSVTVYYRHLPIDLTHFKKSARYDYDTNFVFKIYEDNQQLWYKKSPLTYTGSYSRNMQVGNSQDLSMNSNFNLQVNGYLIDSIYIEGAITDNQLPFQPEGNTQQVQEFDRIYIILQKNKHRLTFGDFNLDKNDNYFLKFNKRAQGVFYQAQDKKLGRSIHDYGISGSISKGQYARNQFEGIEGNQGPYKLIGNNGETFFIILAGTEKVYIDGVLLTRGEDKDYIINYNTSEIIFMPKTLITKDKRILVEFEYQDRNYLNSLIYAYDNIQFSKKLKVQLSLYSNQDAKNQPYLQDISEDQRRFLAGIGDSIHQAYYKNIQEEKFAANKILYIVKDTVIAATGERFEGIYEYSTDSTQTLYNLGFSYVGEQKGHYVISGENTNGRMYHWVAPIDGVPQGQYEPVSLLITPKMHQVYNAALHYSIDSLKSLSIETSASIYDPNLFSSIGNATHLGLAGKIIYSEKRIWGKTDSLQKHLKIVDNLVEYEYLQHNYRAISPFRQIEFSRDWNIFDEELGQYHQHLAHIQSKLNIHQKGHIQYDASYLNQEKFSTAWRQILEAQLNPKNFLLRVKGDMLSSHSLQYQTRFYRPFIAIEKAWGQDGNIKLGSNWALEHNEVSLLSTETLSPYSFSFDTWTTYLTGLPVEGLHWNLKYIQRRERFLDSLVWALNNIGHNIEAGFTFNKIENHQLDVQIGYRYLNLLDTTKIAPQNAGGSLLGRINYTNNIKKGFITTNLQYEFGNGQEQKREYVYVEVPVGQGMYYWIDYNGDGIQQANEFEVGIYPDQKRFIRILTPTNEYIGMSYYNLQATLNINMSKIIEKNPKGISKILSKINNQFSIQTNSKISQSEQLSFINNYIPFTHNNDSLIITENTSLVNTFFYNRTNSKWGIDYTLLYTEGNTLMTYGLEQQSWMRNNLNLRIALNSSFTTHLKYNTGRRQYQSGINDGRSYDYIHESWAPSISYIYAQSWRITGQYAYETKKNKADLGGQEAYLNNLSADIRFSFKKLGSLQSGITYSLIRFNGNENSAVGLIMLDALKNGSNMLWNLQWNTLIMKGIEMSIIYEGRKPAGMPLIHTGNMTIRAIL